MKSIFKFLAIIALTALPVLTSCQKEEAEKFSFEVSGVEGTQAFTFGETKEYTFTSENVSRTSFEKPAGWDARLDFQKKKLIISAPSATDKSGAENGSVIVTVTSNGGQTKTVEIKVAAKDSDISFEVEGISEGLSLKYGETKELKAKMSNVAEIEGSGVSGWKVEKASDSVIKITAPSKTDTGAQTEGVLTLTPKSGRGNVGKAVTVKVSILVAEPSVQLDKAEIDRVDFGSVTVIKTTEYSNVEKFEVKSAPKGWKTDIKTTANGAEITVTAPVKESEMEGIGNIVLLATSETDAQYEVSIKVSLKGINNAEDLLECASQWNKALDDPTRDLSPFTLGGELALNADIDISATKMQRVFNRDFTGIFNGYNHTLKYALESSEGNMALFNTVANPGVVKNLTVEGTMFAKTEQVDRHGCIAAWSDGGTFENIVIKVAYTQEGESCAGYFGGITGDQTNTKGGGIYRNCHFRGTINIQSTGFVGGIIGDVWDNKPDAGKGIIENCSNEADFNVVTKGVRIPVYHGGIVGKCDGAFLTFIDCFNKGNFNYDFGGTKDDAEAIGGVAGKASGTFTRCYNLGNITFKNENPNAGWAHAAGFVAFARASKGDVFKVTGCYNKGNVTAYGEDIATFIAYIRDFGEGQCLITDSYSEGNLDCVFPVSSKYIGGFVSTIYNSAEFRNCRFTGKTRGYATHTAASFVGRACDNVIIDNCESTGNIYVGCHTNVTDELLPLTSGFVTVYYPKTTITNSKATGNVFHMGPSDKSADKVLCSLKVAEGKPGEETSTVDEATLNSAAKVTVTRIDKTDTFPADWK